MADCAEQSPVIFPNRYSRLSFYPFRSIVRLLFQLTSKQAEGISGEEGEDDDLHKIADGAGATEGKLFGKDLSDNEDEMCRSSPSTLFIPLYIFFFSLFK